MVAFRRQEHLRLVGKAAKGLRVDDLVAIALVIGAQRVARAPGRALCAVRERGVGGEQARTLQALAIFALHDLHDGP